MMKESKFTDAQIAYLLRHAGGGALKNYICTLHPEDANWVDSNNPACQPPVLADSAPPQMLQNSRKRPRG